MKTYLCYTIILFNSISFAKKEISILEPNENPIRAANPTTNILPKGNIKEEFETVKKIKDFDPVIKKIADYLWNNPTENGEIKKYVYNKKNTFSPDSSYIVLEYSPKNSVKKLYSFVLKKKIYKNLRGFEKELVDSYYGQNKDIEFLYSYKKYDKDPWAIIINSRIYLTMWVKTMFKELSDLPLEPFLTINNEDEKKTVHLLINEKNHILAKRINKTVIFNN